MRAFKPTPATVLALLALIFAMAGTGIAAKSYVISSSSQVKDGAITGKDIKKSTITGIKIKDKSLTAADFTGSVQGPKGAKGDAGLPGSLGPITYVTGRATVACTPNPIPPSRLLQPASGDSHGGVPRWPASPWRRPARTRNCRGHRSRHGTRRVDYRQAHQVRARQYGRRHDARRLERDL